MVHRRLVYRTESFLRVICGAANQSDSGRKMGPAKTGRQEAERNPLTSVQLPRFNQHAEKGNCLHPCFPSQNQAMGADRCLKAGGSLGNPLFLRNLALHEVGAGTRGTRSISTQTLPIAGSGPGPALVSTDSDRGSHAELCIRDNAVLGASYTCPTHLQKLAGGGRHGFSQRNLL